MINWNAFKKVVCEHKVAIVLALVTSLVVAFPQVYFRIDHKDDGVYQGIELLPDSPWSPRVREVQDGHLNFGSMYWKEGKDGPYLFQPLGSIVVAYIGKIFLLDINNTLLASRLILPSITFLLVYVFVFLLSREKLVALCSTAVILFADSLLSVYGLKKIMNGISPEDFLSIGKPVHNTMIYIPFFAFLVVFWLFYRYKKWSYGLLSAVILGLNFYNYFYTWTYLYAFGGVLGLILLLQKRWKAALSVFCVYLGSLIVAIPYIVNLHRATVHPLYEEVSMRIGILQTHAPLFVGFVVIGAIILFIFWYPRDDKEKYWFGLALLLAPFITLNQQILTGKIMQAGHYHWYFHKPIAIIFTFTVVFFLLSKTKFATYKGLFAMIILTVSIAVGVFIQVDSYYNSTVDGGRTAIDRQKYGPVMEWLSVYGENEAVVFGNDEVSHLVTIYTPLNVFYHRATPFSSLIATEKRLLDVIFTFYRLRGIDITKSRETFFAEREYIATNVYHLYYRELLGSNDAIPDEKIEEILNLYKKTFSLPTDDWIQNIWGTYEVAYIVWDKRADPEWQISRFPFVTEVAVFDNISIYQFSRGTMVSNER